MPFRLSVKSRRYSSWLHYLLVNPLRSRWYVLSIQCWFIQFQLSLSDRTVMFPVNPDFVGWCSTGTYCQASLNILVFGISMISTGHLQDVNAGKRNPFCFCIWGSLQTVQPSIGKLACEDFSCSFPWYFQRAYPLILPTSYPYGWMIRYWNYAFYLLLDGKHLNLMISRPR